MRRVERPLRLPVWPVVPGVIGFLLDVMNLHGLAAALEKRVGGRVAPMSFNPIEADPFILCVAHRHSFWALDPIRPIFRMLLPEGFPAHPHRGFETVTYVLQGGMKHRDSTGVKQFYGADSVQWMTAGRGMLHEEMWAVEESQQELYQIWVNLPGRHKLTQPRIQLLGENVDGVGLGAIPVHSGDGYQVRVVSGEHKGSRSPVATFSPVTILRVTVRAGGHFAHALPAAHTCIVYVRHGAATVVDQHGGGETVDNACTAFLETDGEVVAVENRGASELDFLILAGEPIGEAVASQGSMVMNTDAEIQKAYADYQTGSFGVPWENDLSDEEWINHVDKYRHLMRRSKEEAQAELESKLEGKR